MLCVRDRPYTGKVLKTQHHSPTRLRIVAGIPFLVKYCVCNYVNIITRKRKPYGLNTYCAIFFPQVYA